MFKKKRETNNKQSGLNDEEGCGRHNQAVEQVGISLSSHDVKRVKTPKYQSWHHHHHDGVGSRQLYVRNRRPNTEYRGELQKLKGEKESWGKKEDQSLTEVKSVFPEEE